MAVTVHVNSPESSPPSVQAFTSVVSSSVIATVSTAVLPSDTSGVVSALV